MGQDAADLGMAAAAVDFLHQAAQQARIRHEARGTAFRQASIVRQLDVEPADCGRFLEHVGLQPAGLVPGRLPAHGGVEGKD
jgi:hypothetical protein